MLSLAEGLEDVLLAASTLSVPWRVGKRRGTKRSREVDLISDSRLIV